MSDEEDWDAELGLNEPNPSFKFSEGFQDKNQPPKGLFSEDEDDFDWSGNDEFSEKPLKITGIKADPNAKEEDWDEDFEFSSEKGELKLTEVQKKAPVQRIKSSFVTATANIERLTSFLKDFITKFPEIETKEEVWDDWNVEKKKEETKIVLEDEVDKLLKQAADAKNKNLILKESQAMFDLGSLYYSQNEFVKAMLYFNQTKSLIQGIKTTPSQLVFESELLYKMGLNASALSDFFKAIEYLKKAQESLKSDKQVCESNHELLCKIYYELGLCCFHVDQWAKSIEEIVEGLKIHFETAKNFNWVFIGKSCLQIGKCLQQLSVKDLAQEYFKKAIEASNHGNDNETSSISLSCLSSILGAPTPVPTSVSDTSSGEDIEDWDEEFGLEANISTEKPAFQLPGTPNLSSPSQEFGAQSLVPSRYKLLQECTRSDVEIVKYPKSTFFYSMKTPEGHRLMKEEELEKWISTIVSKHQNNLIHTRLEELKQQGEFNLRHVFFTRLQNIQKFSIEWAQTHLEFATKLGKMNKKELCWEEIFAFFVDLKDAITVKKSESEHEELLHLALRMLYLACKLWKTEEDETFRRMLAYIKKFEPKCVDLVELIEIETHLHHNYGEVEKNIDHLCSIFLRKEKERAEMKSTLPNLNEESLNEIGTVEVQARALCDIHFVLTDISPLTCLHLEYNEDEEEPERRRSRSDSFHELIKKYDGLIDIAKRNNLLSQIYSHLRPSFLKAKAAYALGLYATFVQDDFKLAEQLFFESLYVLDMCKSRIPIVAPIVSELGTNALLRYGEVLLTNYKYQYALGSFESAVLNHKLRKKPGYFSLLRRTATITKDYDDYRRSIYYFSKVLQIYYHEEKTNEIRYVSEMISSLYLEEGDFRRAEKFLDEAHELEKRKKQKTDKIDDISLKILLKLVDIYLDSYACEKGIELLEDLNNKKILPVGSRPKVLAKLAKAYIKKNWFKECNDILSFWENDLLKSSSPQDENSLKFWELSASNFYHSSQYVQALYCIDIAINNCPSTVISSLAHFYYKRGKIFQALCSSSTSVQFPTTLRIQKDTRSSPKVYTCTGDLIQECISSYDRAYSYFKILGDDIHIAKTVNNIATTYLERVFCPVALLHFPYSDLSRLPHFEVSDIAKSLQKTKTNHKRSKSDGFFSFRRQEAQELKEFVITFEKIENPSGCGLEICAETCNIMLIVQSYLNMAELRYLQGETDVAIAFWTEAKEQLMLFFMDENANLLGRNCPSPFIKKLFNLFKRLVRFMFCFDSEFINKDLSVIDAFLLLQMNLSQSQMRPVQSPNSDGNDTKPTKTLSFGRSSKKTLSVQNHPTFPPGGRGSLSARVSVTTLFDPSTDNLPVMDSKSVSTSKFNRGGSEKNEDEKNVKNLSEKTAEYIWGLLYAIKTQIRKYVKGKLSREELFHRNSRYVKKISQAKKNYDIIKENSSQNNNTNSRKSSRKNLRRSSVGFSEHQSLTYNDTCLINPIAPRLMFILQIEEYIIYYVPSTGQKRIQRIGGKEDNLKNTTAINAILYLNVHLLANTEEFVTLAVSPSLTLEKLLKYICNRPYWEEGPKKKTFFGSFGRTPSNSLSNLRTRPKFFDQTSAFYQGLTQLLTLLPQNEGSGSPGGTNSIRRVSSTTNATKQRRSYSTSELSFISFAKKTVNQYDSSTQFVPLTISSQTTISQCFTEQEMKESSSANPLKLFLYLSSNSQSGEFASATNLKKEVLNKTIFLNDDITNYLSQLTSKEVTIEVEQAKRIVTEMTETIFSSLIDLIPYPPPSKESTEKDSAIALICSCALNIFPWELILNEPLIRYFSANDMIQSSKKRVITDSDEFFPRYFSFYYSGGDKNLLSIEEQRRDWLLKYLFHSLNLRSKFPSANRFSNTIYPFHSPLVKYGRKISTYKKKYKLLITWLDLGLLLDGEIAPLVENLSLSSFSIFIFSYTDLLELPESLFTFMRNRTDITFLFIPAHKMKESLIRLSKLQEEYLKTKSRSHLKGRFDFLMTAIATLQTENMVPITVFNPPLS